ncbi:MAG: glutathione S-transferase [Burkholderiales bacterium]|nr:glutathione S-transferase [Burkholderiales bacterium]MDE2394975.1 glutathione S-transferase [Burkholderiales bacterium]MDE2452123.1 glutathione S-transferase [Burkholderiales bacterium]
MLQLHYYPGNASFAPHLLLNEIGVPFELRLVDRTKNAHKQSAYLALNPNGLIPVLVDGGLVLYEAAAVCLHLADRHPQARLAPALGSDERAHFYKWLMWLTNTLQATLIHYFYPERLVDEGNAGGAAQVKAHAQARIDALLQQLDDQFAAHGGPWLLGADYSAADAYAFMLGRWTRGFSSRPAREYAHLGAFMRRMLERTALRKTMATEQLTPPLI